MKTSRHVGLFLLAACTAPAVDHASAQEQEVRRTDEARIRNVPFAGVLEWAVPLAGHAYAGDVARGLLPNVPVFVGAASVMVACSVDPDCGYGREWGGWVIVTSVLAMLAGKYWAVSSAIDTATRTNELLRDRPGIKDAGIGVSVTPARRIAMGVVVRF